MKPTRHEISMLDSEYKFFKGCVSQRLREINKIAKRYGVEQIRREEVSSLLWFVDELRRIAIMRRYCGLDKKFKKQQEQVF